MIDPESTDLRRSDRLYNKPKHKYRLFAKLSIAVVGSYNVALKIHIFLTRENQHTQVININFDRTLNHFVPMIFVENQEQN